MSLVPEEAGSGNERVELAVCYFVPLFFGSVYELMASRNVHI